MTGGRGSDTFVVGPGEYTLVSYKGRTSPIVATADGKANDGARGERDNILPPTGPMTLIGGYGDDKLYAAPRVKGLYGSRGDDILHLRFGGFAFGGPGDDLLLGSPGEDELNGNAGNDVLRGGPGHDYLYGNEDDDFVVGGRNRDWVAGGDGNDTLLTRYRARDRLFGGRGDDRARLDLSLDRFSSVELTLP